MWFGTDGLANFFLFMFLFGLIFTVASLALGFVHAGDADVHLPHAHVPHIGAHGHGAHLGNANAHQGGHVAHAAQAVHSDSADTHLSHADVHGGDDGPGLLNMPTLMAFITWFGGVGFILRHSLSIAGVIAVPVAVAAGAIGGGIMFVLLARVLWPMVTPPMDSRDFSLPGTPARVVSSIRAGGVGEIVYTKRGTRFTAGAKGVDDSAIPKGAEVVILQYERGLALVQGVDTLLSERVTEKAAE